MPGHSRSRTHMSRCRSSSRAPRSRPHDYSTYFDKAQANVLAIPETAFAHSHAQAQASRDKNMRAYELPANGAARSLRVDTIPHACTHLRTARTHSPSYPPFHSSPHLELPPLHSPSSPLQNTHPHTRAHMHMHARTHAHARQMATVEFTMAITCMHAA